MIPSSPSERSTDTRWWFVRSSGDPNRWYRLSAAGGGVIRCECKAAQFRARTPCRHMRAVHEGTAIEARPVRRAPGLTVAGSGFGFQAPEAA